jgi:hypothetical protein
MAGSSMTFVYDNGQDGRGAPGRIRKITASWTSDDATGAVNGTTEKLVGRIIKAINAPGAAGVQPTDNYDIALTDSDGVDLLAGSLPTLGNISNASKTERYFFVKNTDAAPLSTSQSPLVCDKVTIAVTNAGNAKQGAITLYIESL